MRCCSCKHLNRKREGEGKERERGEGQEERKGWRIERDMGGELKNERVM